MSIRVLLLVLVISVGGCLNWGVEEPESDGDADLDGDADHDVEPDGDADQDIETDADLDVDEDEDGGGDADVDGDGDGDGDGGGDGDADGDDDDGDVTGCGDDECIDPENADSCPQDCPASCGDSYCTHEEDWCSCYDDCASCGDGICTYSESPTSCAGDCSIGGWVHVCAGTFTMGSSEGEPGRQDNAPQHEVTLTRNFEILSTEVTQADFEMLMGYNPSWFSEDGEGVACGPACPVEQVSWHEAATYCNALSDDDDLTRCYVCMGDPPNVLCEPNPAFATPYECPGFRLPTEAEWEYAARAGTTTATYEGDLDIEAGICDPSEVLDPIAWWCGTGGSRTHEVGTLQGNPWGLSDVLGNVAEWCQDHPGPYPEEAVIDPTGHPDGLPRITRGGSSSTDAAFVRAARRYWVLHDFRGIFLGLRPVRSLVGTGECEPDCAERVCGDDGCGRECRGGCDDDEVCIGTGTECIDRWTTVEAGTFMMGSPEEEVGRTVTETQHEVTLTRDFEIQTTEVTQAQFTEVMGYNPSLNSGCFECPVEDLTWHEAAAFCNELSRLDARDFCYTCDGTGSDVVCDDSSDFETPYECRGYRLPTEAEWEFAARARTTTAATYEGELDIGPEACEPSLLLDEIAWFCGNSGGETHPVGMLAPNSSRLYDMLGNVWEWCGDGSAIYPSGPTEDPWNGVGSLVKMMRGGSCFAVPRGVRAAHRDGDVPTSSRGDFGFRPVRSLPSSD